MLIPYIYIYIYIVWGKETKAQTEVGLGCESNTIIFKERNADQHLSLISNSSKSRKWV